MPKDRTTKPRGLSKSRLLSWLQCPKRLWLEIFRPEAAEILRSLERRFQVGHEAGRIAQELAGEGIRIGAECDLPQALAETSARLEAGARRLFEPAFQHQGVLVRADILERRRSAFRLREVKISARVEEHHLADAAIQAWVLRGAGLALDAVIVEHIDTGFVYPGGGEYRGLFAAEGVDDGIRPLLREVPRWVAGAQGTLAGDEPAIRTGPQCEKPYACPFLGYCSAKEPKTDYPLEILPNAREALLAQLAAEGYRDVREIPPGRLANARQERVRRVTVSGKPELDPGAARALRKLPYPRYHLDFETVGLPVPVWAGTRPYQQIPFQWSCHIERRGGRLEHRGYLHRPDSPPMRAVADTLLEALGTEGPIFAHSAGFEKGRIEDLAALVPSRARALRALLPRIVDTLPLARDHYYHPRMMGSWSLKAIAPAIAPDLAWSDLGEVQEGGAASDAYAEMIHPPTTAARRAELAAALERYAERDTRALARLVRFLERGR